MHTNKVNWGWIDCELCLKFKVGSVRISLDKRCKDVADRLTVNVEHQQAKCRPTQKLNWVIASFGPEFNLYSNLFLTRVNNVTCWGLKNDFTWRLRNQRKPREWWIFFSQFRNLVLVKCIHSKRLSVKFLQSVQKFSLNMLGGTNFRFDCTFHCNDNTQPEPSWSYVSRWIFHPIDYSFQLLTVDPAFELVLSSRYCFGAEKLGPFPSTNLAIFHTSSSVS